MGSPAYHSAFQAAADALAAARPAAAKTTEALVDRYLSSPEVMRLGERTRADYRKWAERFKSEFGLLAQHAWEDPRIRRDLIDWRNQWGHSPKQADDARGAALRILNWAKGAGEIDTHHCDGIPSLYKADRAEIVWTPEDIARFMAVAPEPARRILTVSLETGFRPGDAIRLSRSHVESTPLGRRILMRTSKRKVQAAIPVSAALAEVIDSTPRGRLLILVSHSGKPLTVNRASQFMGEWIRKAGLREELQWKDARGTAATRLLRADLSLDDIATHMGWSLRYAASVIEHYARIDPRRSDEIMVKLEAARARSGVAGKP